MTVADFVRQNPVPPRLTNGDYVSRLPNGFRLSDRAPTTSEFEERGGRVLREAGAREVNICINSNDAYEITAARPQDGGRVYRGYVVTREVNGRTLNVFYAWDGAMWHTCSSGHREWVPVISSRARYSDAAVASESRLYGAANRLTQNLVHLAQDLEIPGARR